MPIVSLEAKKRRSKTSISIRLAYVERDSGIPAKPGWHEWRSEYPIADYISQEETAVIYLKPMHNTAHRRYLRNEAQKYRKDLRRDTMDEDLQDEIEVRGFALHVIDGYERIFTQESKDAEPVELEHNEKNTMALLYSEPDLYELLRDISSDHDYFEDKAETAKN